VALSIQRDMSWKTLKGQEPQERRPIGLSRRSRGEQHNRAGDAEPIRGAHQSPYGSGAEAHAKRRRQRRRTIKTTVRGENTWLYPLSCGRDQANTAARSRVMTPIAAKRRSVRKAEQQ
jgi:hypothetical protein